MGKDKRQTNKSTTHTPRSSRSQRDLRPFLTTNTQPMDSDCDSQSSSSSSRRRKMADLPNPAVDTSTGVFNQLKGEISEILSHVKSLPTKQDMLTLEANLRDTIRQEVTTIQSDISHLTERVVDLETAQTSSDLRIQLVQDSLATQTTNLRELHNKIDDLDNRGRRNNLRVRGIPEEVPSAGLQDALNKIFGEILSLDPNELIEFDRAHRALRPKGPPNAPPRDVICRLHYFTQKEEILKGARSNTELELNGSKIQIFQDLSWRTLQQRRLLRPLTEELRKNHLLYRWGYPLSLQVSKEGKLYSLRDPAGTQAFCTSLGLSTVQLPNWLDMESIREYPRALPNPNQWQQVQRSRKHQTRQHPSTQEPRAEPASPPH